MINTYSFPARILGGHQSAWSEMILKVPSNPTHSLSAEGDSITEAERDLWGPPGKPPAESRAGLQAAGRALALVGLQEGDAAAPVPHTTLMGNFLLPILPVAIIPPCNQLLLLTASCPCAPHLRVELGSVFSITFLQVAKDGSRVPSLQALSSGLILHILMSLHLALANARRLLDVPLHSIPALQHSHHSSQRGAICPSAQHLLHAIVQATSGDATHEYMAESYPVENDV